MSGKYDQINNMSVKELKSEYYNCSDSDTVKKQILKKIIRNKILSEREKKKEEKQEDEKIQKEINEKLNNLIKIKENAEKDKHKKKLKELDPVIKTRGNMEQYWESNQNIDSIDERFRPEIELDHSNNKMMERLNFELDFRIHGERSKDVIKPYSGADDGNFKEFEKYSIPVNSFSRKIPKH